MAQAPRHTAFGTMHPAVPAAFLACTLGLTMFAPHPVLVSLSLARPGIRHLELCTPRCRRRFSRARSA